MCEYEPENRTALAFTEAGILFQLYTAHLLQGLKNRQYTKERKKKKKQFQFMGKHEQQRI